MVEQAHPSHEELVESLRPALKYALTVHGPVREDKMGIVLPHEHILVDLRTYHEPFYPELEDSPVELKHARQAAAASAQLPGQPDPR